MQVVRLVQEGRSRQTYFMGKGTALVEPSLEEG